MTVLATIIVLGVLIFVHELGHFWAAKLVGVDVERFSIGLGPRVWGFTWGETEYVFSLIPLGGYVKMGGMEDEVMERLEGGSGTEDRVPGPGDFDGKPIWARGLVFSAGVIMNMVFAFLVYATVSGFWGVRELATTRIGHVYETALPEGTEGLADIPIGAELTRIGGHEIDLWSEVTSGIVEAPPGPLTLEYSRPEGSVEIRVPADEEARTRTALSLGAWADAEVGMVNPGSPAEKGGIEVGDEVLAVEGVPVENWYDFLNAIRARPGARVELQLRREGRELTRVVELNAQESEDPITGDRVTVGQIGIWRSPDNVIYTEVGVGEAVVMGYRQTVAMTATILGFLRDLFTGGVSPRSVGSIVTIGAASGQAAEEGLDTFLSFMALFSINLAILNLLPIPVLDGGHLLFLAIEALRGGRALSVEQRLRWSQVGFVVLLGIMVWALSNDFMRLLGL